MLFSTHSLLIASIASFLTLIQSCPEHEHHGQHHFSTLRFSNSKSSTGGAVRSLQWGDVQIIHTTDIHGWYSKEAGSTEPEPDFSGDWGDFASFVARELRKR